MCILLLAMMEVSRVSPMAKLLGFSLKAHRLPLLHNQILPLDNITYAYYHYYYYCYSIKTESYELSLIFDIFVCYSRNM